MKRTPLQRHNRAMNLAHETYRAWQTSEAGMPVARRKHSQYVRVLAYLDALEEEYPVFKDDWAMLFSTF